MPNNKDAAYNKLKLTVINVNIYRHFQSILNLWFKKKSFPWKQMSIWPTKSIICIPYSMLSVLFIYSV